MVDQKRLDDFLKGDWIGVHYQEPFKLFYDFPTIVEKVSNRNENPLDDFVEVTLALEGCSHQLKREYISRIWHVGEIHG